MKGGGYFVHGRGDEFVGALLYFFSGGPDVF